MEPFLPLAESFYVRYHSGAIDIKKLDATVKMIVFTCWNIYIALKLLAWKKVYSRRVINGA